MVRSNLSGKQISEIISLLNIGELKPSDLLDAYDKAEITAEELKDIDDVIREKGLASKETAAAVALILTALNVLNWQITGDAGGFGSEFSSKLVSSVYPHGVSHFVDRMDYWGFKGETWAEMSSSETSAIIGGGTMHLTAMTCLQTRQSVGFGSYLQTKITPPATFSTGMRFEWGIGTAIQGVEPYAIIRFDGGQVYTETFDGTRKETNVVTSVLPSSYLTADNLSYSIQTFSNVVVFALVGEFLDYPGQTKRLILSIHFKAVPAGMHYIYARNYSTVPCTFTCHSSMNYNAHKQASSITQLSTPLAEDTYRTGSDMALTATNTMLAFPLSGIILVLQDPQGREAFTAPGEIALLKDWAVKIIDPCHRNYGSGLCGATAGNPAVIGHVLDAYDSHTSAAGVEETIELVTMDANRTINRLCVDIDIAISTLTEGSIVTVSYSPNGTAWTVLGGAIPTETLVSHRLYASNVTAKYVKYTVTSGSEEATVTVHIKPLFAWADQ